MKVQARITLKKNDSFHPMSLCFIHENEDQIDAATFIEYAWILRQEGINTYSNDRYGDSHSDSHPGFFINFSKKRDYEAVLMKCFSNLPAFDELVSALRAEVTRYEQAVGINTEEQRKAYHNRPIVSGTMWSPADKRADTRSYSVSVKYPGVTLNTDYFSNKIRDPNFNPY